MLLLFGLAEAQSADQEKAGTNFNLGLRYQTGEGVRKDLSKAAELYLKAANQGYDPAIKQLKARPGD